MRNKILTNEDLLDLLDKVKNGDNVAFTCLHDTYQHVVRKTIWNIIHHTEIVDEITNTVFFKVYKKLDTFIKNDSFEAWLVTITTNSCYDYLRRIQRHKDNLLLVDNYQSYNLPDTKNAEISLINYEQDEIVKQHISKLPGKKKEVFNMYYYEKKSYQEISDALNIPLNTVRSHIRRAKQRLSTFLQT